jgi:hypothetical protein
MAERSAVLVLSVWDSPSPERVRARLSVIDDVTKEQIRVGAAAGLDDIAAAVRAWVEGFVAEGDADVDGDVTGPA